MQNTQLSKWWQTDSAQAAWARAINKRKAKHAVWLAGLKAHKAAKAAQLKAELAREEAEYQAELANREEVKV